MPEHVRKIYEITGPDARDFLQNLVSNDMNRLKDGAMYAALLNPQGKYLADFLLVPQGDAILLDVAEPLAAGLVQRLSMYKLRANVQISESALQLSRGTGEPPEGAVMDPRHPALGWRLYSDTAGDDGSDWDAIRVAHCIPETGIELTPDTYILEAGFERLNGVDFRKGCYVGQEVTARMKHKTELRKGLMTVAIDGTAPVGTDILTADGKTAGTLFTQSGGQAIAYMRFDRADGPLSAENASISVPATQG
ncbi:folate-binding protein YgfZ [Donghicola sp. C2-DW-16]|uniref:Folate-binding protein YgfZ n=1 Tax=Donghicola mangrovi TaxID=2729614 RepID=A0ABX2PD97_9RHOB|nr:folate-binding protein YgfZ [Donghicola mangrovi]NVO27433.1 folate-binding protein YgfZ [Donghicola mangrovi]